MAGVTIILAIIILFCYLTHGSKNYKTRKRNPLISYKLEESVKKSKN